MVNCLYCDYFACFLAQSPLLRQGGGPSGRPDGISAPPRPRDLAQAPRGPRPGPSTGPGTRRAAGPAPTVCPRHVPPGRGWAGTRGAGRSAARPLSAPAAGALTAAGPGGAGGWPRGAGPRRGPLPAMPPSRPGRSLRRAPPRVSSAARRLWGARGRYPPLSSSAGRGEGGRCPLW